MGSMIEPKSSEFWAACGASGPLNLVVEGDALGTRSWSLPQPFALVGDGDRADVTLLDEQVSKRHAFLQVVAGRVCCVDLRSRSGTRWGGENRPSGWLLTGHSIAVGPYTIRLGEGGGPAANGDADRWNLPDPLEPSVPGQDDLPDVLLEATELESRPSWRLDRTLNLVGRSPCCQIALADQGLSRFHCSLLRTRHGVWAVDLRGHEALEVNGTKRRWSHLEDGDEVRMGKVLFHVHCTSAQDACDRMGVRPRTTAIVPVASVHPPQRQLQPWAVVVDASPENWLRPVPEADLALLGRSAESLLRLIDQQLEIRQRETCEQIQRSISDMIEALAIMHSDHMELVRMEFEQIRRLTSEVKVLQDGISRVAARRQVATAATQLDREPAPDKRANNRPVPPSRQTRSDRCDSGRRVRTDEPKGEKALWTNDADLHDKLTRRIDALQRERRSRWKRLMAVVVGNC
jgi:predicted component of type VI protein secretion system